MRWNLTNLELASVSSRAEMDYVPEFFSPHNFYDYDYPLPVHPNNPTTTPPSEFFNPQNFYDYDDPPPVQFDNYNKTFHFGLIPTTGSSSQTGFNRPVFCLLNTSEWQINDEGSNTVLPPFFYYINGPVTGAVVLLGGAINLLSLFPLMSSGRSNHSRRSPIALYLSALALWNSGLLLAAFLMYALPTLCFGRLHSYGSYVHIYRLAFGVGSVTVIGSVWILVALVVDRCVALLWPFYHRRHFGGGRTPAQRRMIVIVSLLAIICGWPRIFEFSIYDCVLVNNDPPILVSVIKKSDLAKSHTYVLLYLIIGRMTTQSVVPYAILLVLSIKVLLLLRDNQQTKSISVSINSDQKSVSLSRHRHSKEQQYATDYLLMVLIGKFLLFNLAPTILVVWEHFGLNSTELATNVMIHVGNLLIVLNAATNSVVYLIVSKQFRNRCAQLTCCAEEKDVQSTQYRSTGTMLAKMVLEDIIDDRRFTC